VSERERERVLGERERERESRRAREGERMEGLVCYVETEFGERGRGSGGGFVKKGTTW
jgi:hypothetical protein